MKKRATSLRELGAKKLNRQQQEAVGAVLVGAGGGQYPLALLGPPGTGKTVTLVECALQVSSITLPDVQQVDQMQKLKHSAHVDVCIHNSGHLWQHISHCISVHQLCR